ncbi:MAG: glycosyltransferase [Flavobacterium sp.]|nr:MAG: glycosyltransferase [Flavobacterium sp.]
MKPKLSIITINYNNFAGLRSTITSVLSQTSNEYEYVVIDGGSNDGSRDLISENDSNLSYWISEKDCGVYHAMNKGILASSGEYILFINSGDYLVNNSVLDDAMVYLADTDLIYGDILFRHPGAPPFLKTYPPNIDFEFFLSDSLPHPCTFIKRDVFNSVGLYDEDFSICSDYKFFLDAICKFNCSSKHIDIAITSFGLDGISSVNESRGLLELEKKEILNSGYSEWMRMHEKIKRLELELRSLNSSTLFRALKRMRII